MITIDVRGLSCPEPVFRSRRGIEEAAPGEDVEILVESATSRDNVLRALAGMGLAPSVERIDDGFRLVVSKL